MMFKKKEIPATREVSVTKSFDSSTGKRNEDSFRINFKSGEHVIVFGKYYSGHAFDSHMCRSEALDLYEMLGRALLTGETQTR